MYVCVASQHKQLEACTGHLLNLRELAGAGAPWQKIPPEDAKLQQRANQEFTVVIKFATKDGKLLGCQRKPKLLTLLTYFTCGEEEGWSASKVEVTESWVLLIIISGDESRKDKALIIVVIIITLLRLLPLP